MRISVGKYRGFMRIANSLGQFNMLALDQRNSLKKMIKERKGDVEHEDLVMVKRAILKNLSDKVTAVLVDGEYGFPENVKYVSNATGMILSLEKSGYVSDEENPDERLSRVFREDVCKFAKKNGFDAVKLLVYWSENVSEKTKAHQMKMVEEIGQNCYEEDMLYILEILTYNVEGEKTDTILKAIKVFADERYKVDLFKVEPIVKTHQFGLKREDIYEFSNGKPWVILSGGMDVETFKDVVKWNCQLGACGFLAGRVIWKGAPMYVEYPELMDLHLKNTALYNLELLKLNAKEATPFFKTPYFEGLENVKLVEE